MSHLATTNPTFQTAAPRVFAPASGPYDAPPSWPMRVYKLLARPVHFLAWRFKVLELAVAFIERELRSGEKVPARVRPWLLSRGFLRGAWVIYDLANNDPDLYITDYERYTRTRLINGPHAVVLDDKFLFYRLFDGPLSKYVPPVFGTLSGTRVIPVNCLDEPVEIKDILERQRRLAVKPCGGGGGAGFSSLTIDKDGVVSDNGNVLGPEGLAQFAGWHAGHLVCGFVKQHPAISAIYPRTTNTMRILIMQDEQDAPFIAAATLRLGSSTSGPTDRVDGGGYCAEIDIETGRLGKGVQVNGDRLTWHTHHGDTGAQIEGFEIPHWQQIQSELRAVMGRHRFLRYVGWDVVVTEDGFSILEGNNFSGLRYLQVHRPMLSNPRVAAFYLRHGVLKGPRRRKFARAACVA
ncbi:MAG: sugar-transfer associated ATP-grasp domain-containing protein [Acetobacterales bacterium]